MLKTPIPYQSVHAAVSASSLLLSRLQDLAHDLSLAKPTQWPGITTYTWRSWCKPRQHYQAVGCIWAQNCVEMFLYFTCFALHSVQYFYAFAIANCKHCYGRSITHPLKVRHLISWWSAFPWMAWVEHRHLVTLHSTPCSVLCSSC